MVVSPSLSSLASTGLVVVVMVLFTLLAGSAALLGSVSFLEYPFSDSFSGRGSKNSSCVFMLLTGSFVSVSFLVCASTPGDVYPGRLESVLSFMLLPMFLGKALPNGWLPLGGGASGLAYSIPDDTYLGRLDSVLVKLLAIFHGNSLPDGW